MVYMVGVSVIDNFGVFEEVAAIELPALDQLIDGDLMILVTAGGAMDDPASRAECGDPRMTPLAQVTSDVFAGQWLNVYAGTVGADRSPLAIRLKGTPSGGLAELFATAQLIVLRDDTGSAVELDFDRVGGNAGGGYDLFDGFINTPPVTNPLAIPTAGYFNVPGDGDAALGILVEQGGVGGSYANSDWTRVAPEWRPLHLFGAYVTVSYFVTEETSVPTMVVPNAAGPRVDLGEFDDQAEINPGGPIFTYGVNILGNRPTRQYPRDDGVGMSSAPRLYPPPKSRRVVGGQQ